MPHAHPLLRVACLARAEHMVRLFGATHVVSLIDPDMRSELPDFERLHVEHMTLLFYDQEREDAAAAVSDATRKLISALRELATDASARVLFHCHAGASRSPAAAFIASALWQPELDEVAVFARLLEQRILVKPWPNLRMVSVADDVLGRAGHLVGTIQRYRAAHPNRLAAYRRLNRRRGIASKVPR